MKKIKIRLQLFAEGAEGEAATAAEVANETQTADETEVAAQEQAEEGQLATDNNEGEDLDAEFEGLIKGKFKNQFENVFKKGLDRRMRGSQKYREQVDAQQPIMDALKKRYGVEDAGELVRAVEEDALYIKHRAMETGESEENILSEIRSKREQRVEEQKREADNRELEEFRRERANRAKVAGWQSEAEVLKGTYPTLDLFAELGNKDFVKMLELGVPMKNAYEAIHHDEIMRGAISYTAEKIQKQTTDTIKVGANRPRENGMSSQASAQTTIDVNSLTEKDIMAILTRVENGEYVIL